MTSEFLAPIASDYPKAFSYYTDFFKEQYKIESPDSVHFDLLLGTFIAFFNSINSDIQFYSIERDVLKESVIEAFETYNEYLFLDS